MPLSFLRLAQLVEPLAEDQVVLRSTRRPGTVTEADLVLRYPVKVEIEGSTPSSHLIKIRVRGGTGIHVGLRNQCRKD